jgi:rhodanese-related sulfurtransferase
MAARIIAYDHRAGAILRLVSARAVPGRLTMINPQALIKRLRRYLIGGGRGPIKDKRARIEELFAEDNAERRDAPYITAEEWLRLREKPNAVLVDVRPEAERRVSIIPGAISRGAFDAERARYAGYTIVCYCTIGGRSGVTTEELRRRGLNALNLKGSVLSWAHAGQTFVTPSGEETRRVHVYGPKWDLLPEGYEAVW